MAKRLDMLARLRSYMLGNDPTWLAAKEKAFQHNGWFTPAFIDTAIQNIAGFLEPSQLRQWLGKYPVPAAQPSPKIIGLILSGNIPMAGIYDFICVYLSGHYQRIRLSPKDEVLLKHLVQTMSSWDDDIAGQISFHDMLRGCDAYVGAGNLAPGPLAQYFSKYPCIIRTATRREAMLDGNESREELELLADDVFTYFGQGCLNVTRVRVPRNYDFIPLLKALEKYQHLVDHNKYMNNYDYQLAMLILNKEFYMTNGCILLTESASVPSPIARLNYGYYDDGMAVFNEGQGLVSGKGLSGNGFVPLGQAGRSIICEELNDMDTLKFLLDL
ncbi:MAG TPA: acyl-CoA reductase [Chitinophagaceae bacterium]|nr:acyl-CoA reductase [Chitinophagaceae bacterium]